MIKLSWIFLHSTIFVQTIGKLTSDQQSLEAKLAEMERLKAAADESSAEERYSTSPILFQGRTLANPLLLSGGW